MDFGLILRLLLLFFFFEELVISILIDHRRAHSCPKTALISLFTLLLFNITIIILLFPSTESEALQKKKKLLRVRARSTLYSLTSQLYPLLLSSQQSHF